MTQAQSARFSIGQVVRHREAAFRGVVLDVDAAYAGPAGQTGAVSPDQPFYSVFVREDDGGGFVAYAAQDALLDDPDVLRPEDARRWFTIDAAGHHAPLDMRLH